MEREKTIFDFLGNVFCIYGITATILILIAFFFGETAKEISGIFRLGRQGIPLEVMAEFLLTSFLVTCMQYLFFSEKLFKRLSGTGRTVCMLQSILTITCMAIWGFGWFPVNMWEPWVCFIVCFAISVAVSIGVMRLKMKAEDWKLEEGLNRMKKKWEGEEK